MRRLRLGVNIDHVATLRNARGGPHPDPIRAAQLVKAAGGDGITAHLREDRRHIGDRDIARLVGECDLPLNLEMAATEAMEGIAKAVRPHACCIVPERREERTTENGLDVAGNRDRLARLAQELRAAGIRVSLFVDPAPAQLEAAKAVGADIVELHTGAYCEAQGEAQAKELGRLAAAAAHARSLGLECHAGHGLGYDSVGPVAALPELVELNIGHFLIGEAIFSGFVPAVRRMRELMDEAVSGATGGAAATQA